MNLADQIEAVARASTGAVAAASRRFSIAREEASERLDEYRRATASGAERLRADLRAQADAADATPGIMLPADMAQASPHLPESSE